MTRDERILLAHKVFEKEHRISDAAREINKAKLHHAEVVKEYHKSVADALNCKVEEIQFSDSVACFGTRLVMHCVWDLRTDRHWPCCVFCGAPRDGE